MSHPHGDSPEPATAGSAAQQPAQAVDSPYETQSTSAPATAATPPGLTPATSAVSQASYQPAAADQPPAAQEPAAAAQPTPAAAAQPAAAVAPSADATIAQPAGPIAAAPVAQPAGATVAGYPTAAYPAGPAGEATVTGYPALGMPQQVAPVSAPGYAPGYAQVSAVPGYSQVSAVPYGMPGYQIEAPRKKGRVGIIVLSILTGLLTLGAAGMTTLYFVEKSERTAADKKVAEQAATITTEQAKVKDLEGKWAQTKSEVAKLTQEVEGAKSKTADVTKEKEALAACFRAMDDYFVSQTNANRQALQTACDEASKYY